jgi:hypothetical protein
MQVKTLESYVEKNKTMLVLLGGLIALHNSLLPGGKFFSISLIVLVWSYIVGDYYNIEEDKDLFLKGFFYIGSALQLHLMMSYISDYYLILFELSWYLFLYFLTTAFLLFYKKISIFLKDKAYKPFSVNILKSISTILFLLSFIFLFKFAKNFHYEFALFLQQLSI